MFKKGFVILTSLFLLISSQTSVFGQFPSDLWTVQFDASPAATIIRGVDFTGISMGCAVGDDGAGNGVILITHDGVGWQDRSSAGIDLTGIPLNDVSFHGSRGIAVGSGGNIFVTNDGGNNWTAATSGTTENLYGVVMPEYQMGSMVGWAVGGGTVGPGAVVLKTEDEGDNWTEQTTASGLLGNANDILRDVDAVWDENTSVYKVMAVGDFGTSNITVIRTPDGDDTWVTADNAATAYYPGNSGLNLNGVSLVYDNENFIVHAWLVGVNGKIWYTNEMGANPYADQTPGLAAGDVLNGVEFIMPNYGCAVGKTATDGGVVFITEDGGLNWILQRNFDGVTPYRELFDVALDWDYNGGGPFGWAVGGDGANMGVILNYPTYRVYIDSPALVSGNIGEPFSFPISVAENIDHRYNVSSFEMIIYWDNRNATADDAGPLDMSTKHIGEMDHFLIDNNEIVGVTTFDTLKIAAAGDAVSFGNLICLSGYGELMSLNFVLEATGTDMDPLFQSFHFMFNENLPGVLLQMGPPPAWFGDADGDEMLTTSDASLILQYRVDKATIAPKYMDRANVSGIMEVTAYDAALILQWIAGLMDWFPVEHMPYKAAAKFDNRMAEIIIASKVSSGSNIVVYQIQAEDIYGVLSAELLLNYDSQNLKYIGYELTENTRGFIVETAEGEEGLLSVAMAGGKPLNDKTGLISLRFENKGGVPKDIQLISAMLNESNVENVLYAQKDLSIPERYVLFQNFPNPFNPETVIRYQITKNTKVVLKIFNMSGQEVRTLINEVKSAGSYSVKWSGKNDIGMTVSSGIYLYKIQAGRFVDTKKLVFLK